MQAEGQCRAGQLLAGLGLDISLPGIRAATPAAAKDVLMVLLAKLADTVPPLSESRSAHPSAHLSFLLNCPTRYQVCGIYLEYGRPICRSLLTSCVMHDPQKSCTCCWCTVHSIKASGRQMSTSCVMHDAHSLARVADALCIPSKHHAGKPEQMLHTS